MRAKQSESASPPEGLQRDRRSAIRDVTLVEPKSDSWANGQGKVRSPAADPSDNATRANTRASGLFEAMRITLRVTVRSLPSNELKAAVLAVVKITDSRLAEPHSTAPRSSRPNPPWHDERGFTVRRVGRCGAPSRQSPRTRPSSRLLIAINRIWSTRPAPPNTRTRASRKECLRGDG